MIPATATWVADELVVVSPAAGSGLARGDVILAIDGTSVAELYADIGGRISTSTEGWRRAKSIRQILAAGEGDDIEVRTPDGRVEDRTIRRLSSAEWSELQRPAFLLAEEIEPGIRYVDLNQLDWQDLEVHLDDLAAADGIIFDLRGYPGSAGKEVLHRLTDEMIHSAYWHVPKMMKPNFADVEYTESRWNVNPLGPRFPKNIVFITGGGAISLRRELHGDR